MKFPFGRIDFVVADYFILQKKQFFRHLILTQVRQKDKRNLVNIVTMVVKESIKLFDTFQSRALNNWVRFSTGLLKKLYMQHEDVLYLKKRDYLNERERYLDDQLKGYINEERNIDSRDLDLMLCIKAVGTFSYKDSQYALYYSSANNRFPVARSKYCKFCGTVLIRCDHF